MPLKCHFCENRKVFILSGQSGNIVWCRSPHGYTDLRNSKFVFLPSQKLLQRYKNQVDQESGFKKDILHWMRNEAALKNIPPEGFNCLPKQEIKLIS
jgi:hypothetical protein